MLYNIFMEVLSAYVNSLFCRNCARNTYCLDEKQQLAYNELFPHELTSSCPATLTLQIGNNTRFT